VPFLFIKAGGRITTALRETLDHHLARPGQQLD